MTSGIPTFPFGIAKTNKRATYTNRKFENIIADAEHLNSCVP